MSRLPAWASRTETLQALAEVAGALCFVIAAFLIHAALGFAVLGAALIVAGNLRVEE